MKRYIVFSLLCCIIFICGIIAGGCSTSSPTATNSHAPSWAPGLAPLTNAVTVKVGMKQVSSDAGILIGIARGYYQDLGIKIEAIQFSSGQEMINQLAAGQLDVGATVSSAGLFNAMGRDIPVKIVADKGFNVPGKGYYRLVVRKGLEDKITQYSDLRARKIAIVGTASLDEIALSRILQQGGLSIQDIDLQVIRSFPDMLVSFANSSIDAAMLIEPFITQGMGKNLIDPWKDPSAYDPKAQTAILVFGTGLSKQPDIANRFMTAYIKSMRDYNDAFFKGKETQSMIDLLCQYSVVKDPQLYKSMFPTGLNPNGYLKLSGIAADLEWYKQYGLLKNHLDLADAVDHQYIDFALKELGSYE